MRIVWECKEKKRNEERLLDFHLNNWIKCCDVLKWGPIGTEWDLVGRGDQKKKKNQEFCIKLLNFRCL